MQLEIDFQRGILGLEIEAPRFQLSQGPASFQIRQSRAQLEIDSDLGSFRVESKDHYEDIGLYKPPALGEKAFHDSRQESLEAIASIARDGDYLASIEDGNTISSLYWMKSFEGDVEVNLGYKRGAEVEFLPGQLEMDYSRGELDLNTSPYQGEGSFEWGRVRAYLMQKPELEISLPGRNFDGSF